VSGRFPVISTQRNQHGSHHAVYPCRIVGITLKHRVVMPPLSRLRALRPSGVPSDLNLEYYSQRASHDGLIFTEATAVSPIGRGYRDAPGIYSDGQVAGWNRVMATVHNQERAHIRPALACRPYNSRREDGRTAGHGLSRSDLPGRPRNVGRDAGRFLATFASSGTRYDGDCRDRRGFRRRRAHGSQWPPDRSVPAGSKPMRLRSPEQTGQDPSPSIIRD